MIPKSRRLHLFDVKLQLWKCTDFPLLILFTQFFILNTKNLLPFYWVYVITLKCQTEKFQAKLILSDDEDDVDVATKDVKSEEDDELIPPTPEPTSTKDKTGVIIMCY